MLNENDFKLIEKQASKLYGNLELEIIEEMAERIANVGYANTVVYNNAAILQEMGVLYEDVVKMVAKYNETNTTEIEEIFENAGIKSLERDDTIYKLAGLTPKGLNVEMTQLLEATAKKTGYNLERLTNTIANTSQVQFIEAMNTAYMEVSTGTKSYSQSILDAIKNISNKGAQVEYPSGYKLNIESATRINILTGVNQCSSKLQLLRGKELGWGLYEVSAHGGARPEHAEWQGKVYTEQQLYDICEYGTVTGLCGANCRHTFRPYYKGSSLTYSEPDLKELKNQTVEYNGKSISKYEASQMQRKMERQIRQDKKDIAGLEGILTSDSKDDKLLEDTKNKLALSKAKLSQDNSILNNFVEQTGFKKDNVRLFIGKINKIQDLDIAEPLNKLINTYPKQQTTKNITKIIEKYDKDKKIKIDYLNEKPFRYSKTQNKVLINPNHPDFEKYNIKEAIMHEIAHMVDMDNEISKNIDNRINKLEKVLLNQKDNLNTILESDKYINNVYLSDLFAGITKNEVYGGYAHELNYWNDRLKRNSEIVANIEVIYLKQDKKALELINSISELKDFYKEVIKKYAKII